MVSEQNSSRLGYTLLKRTGHEFWYQPQQVVKSSTLRYSSRERFQYLYAEAIVIPLHLDVDTGADVPAYRGDEKLSAGSMDPSLLLGNVASVSSSAE